MHKSLVISVLARVSCCV